MGLVRERHVLMFSKLIERINRYMQVKKILLIAQATTQTDNTAVEIVNKSVNVSPGTEFARKLWGGQTFIFR